VILAITAGCSTVGITGQPSPTVTPAPVPTAEPTTTASQVLPPGVNGDGVVDAGRLVRAHQRSITNRSYTWSARRLATGPGANTTTVGDLRKRAHVESERVYGYWTNHRIVWRDGRPRNLGNYSTYSDPTGRYVRYESAEATTEYDRLSTSPARVRVGREAMAAIDQFLPAQNATLSITRIDGQRYYELNGEGTDTVVAHSGVRNYSVRALIAPEGFVRSITVTYQTGSSDRARTVRYGYRYESVGETTVERPDWVSEQWGDRRTNTETGRERTAPTTGSAEPPP
jgi:hypothetical protein